MDAVVEAVPEEELDFLGVTVAGCRLKKQHIAHRRPCEELRQLLPTIVRYYTNFLLVAFQKFHQCHKSERISLCTVPLVEDTVLVEAVEAN